MPLYVFYTMVQKKSKMTKNSNQGGGVLPQTRYISYWWLRQRPKLTWRDVGLQQNEERVIIAGASKASLCCELTGWWHWSISRTVNWCTQTTHVATSVDLFWMSRSFWLFQGHPPEAPHWSKQKYPFQLAANKFDFRRSSWKKKRQEMAKAGMIVICTANFAPPARRLLSKVVFNKLLRKSSHFWLVLLPLLILRIIVSKLSVSLVLVLRIWVGGWGHHGLRFLNHNVSRLGHWTLLNFSSCMGQSVNVPFENQNHTVRT